DQVRVALCPAAELIGTAAGYTGAATADRARAAAAAATRFADAAAGAAGAADAGVAAVAHVVGAAGLALIPAVADGRHADADATVTVAEDRIVCALAIAAAVGRT